MRALHCNLCTTRRHAQSRSDQNHNLGYPVIALFFLLLNYLLNKFLLLPSHSTGQEKRSFNPEGSSTWPIFRWSHDDKYFARMVNDVLSIYQTPSFGLLEKKSIKIPGIRDFSWSPTDNVIAYWVAEDKDVPAKVTLLEIPNRNEIRNKNLFNVADCKIHWQKSGDYLCVKVDRYSKVKEHCSFCLLA